MQRVSPVYGSEYKNSKFFNSYVVIKFNRLHIYESKQIHQEKSQEWSNIYKEQEHQYCLHKSRSLFWSTFLYICLLSFI